MIVKPRHIQEIRNLVQGHVLTDVLLSRFTSFKIGGPADLVVEPANVESLAQLLRYLDDENVPRMILGAGTNVLFSDEGFRGVVVRTGTMSGLGFHANGSDHVRVRVAAGVPLPSVVSEGCKLGWTGLEELWGIPGSFGGAVVTNAGSGPISVADSLVSVKLLTRRGDEVTVQKEELVYGYRSISLPAGTVVVEGTLKLSRADRETIEARLEAARGRRRGQQPLGRASAGCVFKNPSPDNPAGAIIDRLGFKGLAVGDAQVSEIHANFIINRGKARARDVLELIETIRATVREKESVNLELEICVIGGDAAHG